MQPFLELQNITLDIPIFDVQKSFRNTLFQKYIGGYIAADKNTNTVSVRALENISFSLKKGDRLGIVGHNGAGKTTLLRILAGVYKPMYGVVKSHGKITPLFNITLGLDLDDTGIENIKTVGTYLGMTSQQITEKTEEIVEFCELGNFINLPVKTYSSGMLTRLSFGIATALEPEIILMDEGIGAGDARFAQKAKDRLDGFYKNISILVMASHSDQMIRDLCNKAVLLEHGKMIALGEVEEILNLYHNRVPVTV